ncbi:MAG: helix-turn-helix domain-containing protein [Clostridia bacterium]|nr:helix-turn-helix domain-containing protein [Clostridia bacterium]
MNEENKVSYYAIIPANVRYDSELTDKAKLLYGEITCLSNKEGYCFATNNYFAKLYNCTTRAIQGAISKLQERGYVKIVIENNYKRKIFISSLKGDEKNFTRRYEDIFTRGDEKNFTNNNININKIDRLFNYIINKEQKIPEEFSETNFDEIYNLLQHFDMLYTEKIINCIGSENVDKIKQITYAIALIVKDNLQNYAYKITRDDIIDKYNECKNRENEYRGTEREIEDFSKYYYKSIANELKRGVTPSFFMSQNQSANEDEEER